MYLSFQAVLFVVSGAKAARGLQHDLLGHSTEKAQGSVYLRDLYFINNSSIYSFDHQQPQSQFYLTYCHKTDTMTGVAF